MTAEWLTRLHRENRRSKTPPSPIRHSGHTRTSSCDVHMHDQAPPGAIVTLAVERFPQTNPPKRLTAPYSYSLPLFVRTHILRAQPGIRKVIPRLLLALHCARGSVLRKLLRSNDIKCMTPVMQPRARVNVLFKEFLLCPSLFSSRLVLSLVGLLLNEPLWRCSMRLLIAFSVWCGLGVFELRNFEVIVKYYADSLADGNSEGELLEWNSVVYRKKNWRISHCCRNDYERYVVLAIANYLRPYYILPGSPVSKLSVQL